MKRAIIEIEMIGPDADLLAFWQHELERAIDLMTRRFVRSSAGKKTNTLFSIKTSKVHEGKSSE